MSKHKVTINTETCIGCGACATATTNIEMKEIEGSMKAVLKKAGFLSRDARMKERKKPGQPGARKRFQFSKR